MARSLWLASVSVAALSAALPAHAQVTNWTGFYLGANVGHAWGRSDTTSSANCTPPPDKNGYICTSTGGFENAASVASTGGGTASGTSAIGGFQTGYNWQIQNFVFGFETDASATAISASRTASARYPVFGGGVSAGTPYTIQNTMDAHWLMTARGRVGAAFANMMLYATGGLAAARVRLNTSYSDDSPAAFIGAAPPTISKWKYGWAAGGGVEWALTRNISVKSEYLFVNLGSIAAQGIVSPGGFSSYASALSASANLAAHIARAGINYRF